MTKKQEERKWQETEGKEMAHKSEGKDTKRN